MQKTALDIDRERVLRTTGAGLAAGGATAAILNLLHYIQEQRRLAEEAKEVNDTNKNTMVITLPSGRLAKQSEDNCISTTPTVKTTNIAKTGNTGKVQLRKPAGTYRTPISKIAATSVPTYVTEGLGLLGGAGVGYLTIDKLYSMLRKRQMKQELEEAKQEYFKSLFGEQGKEASDNGLEKQSINLFNKVIAGYLLLSLLGTGGVGYLTKKVLDEKFKEPDVPSTMPRVKKIVFRTNQSQPAEEEVIDETKQASEKTIAALGVEIDRQTDRFNITGEPEVVAALKEAGITKEDLFNMMKDSASFTENLIAGALENDNLRNSLVNSTMSKIPALGSLWDTIGGNELFEDRIKSKIAGAAMSKIRGNKGLNVLSGAANLLDYLPGSGSVASAIGRGAGNVAGYFKQGQLDPADLASSLMEGMDGDPRNNVKDEQDQYISDLEKDIKLKSLAKPVVDNVDILAQDPNAAMFVASKKDTIKKILRTMVSDKEL